MKHKFMLAGIASLLAMPTYANKLSADLNPETFHFQADATHASNGLIYSAELFLTRDNGEAGAIVMRTEGQVGRNTHLSGGLGGKLHALNHDNKDAALSLGGRLAYDFPGSEGISLSGELFYAPGIVASGDIESLIDFNLRLNYALFENASVYAGARHLEVEYDFGWEHEFDSGLHAGIQIDF